MTRYRIAGSIAAVTCMVLNPVFAHDLPAVPIGDSARLKTRVLCSCLLVQQMSMTQCSDGGAAIWRYLFPVAPKLLETPRQRLTVEMQPSAAIVRFLADDKVLAQSYFIDDGGGCVTDEPGSRNAAAGERESRKARDPDNLTVQRRAKTQPVAWERAPLPKTVDVAAVDRILRDAFSVEGSLGGSARAAFAVLDGRVVIERYARGFGPQNSFYLGSVAKCFNNLLGGLLVRDGKLRIGEAVDRPAWRTPGDSRRGITFDHLLHMTGGISWDEEFFKPGAPAYDIYFAGPAGLNVARFMAARPSEAAPGAHFEYSTGSSALLARVLQERLGGDPRTSLLQYLGRELFDPLGITGITLEFDRAGTYLAGHAAYSSAEDLARIGMLLLQDGLWQGRRILPEGWLEYSTRPTPTPG